MLFAENQGDPTKKMNEWSQVHGHKSPFQIVKAHNIYFLEKHICIYVRWFFYCVELHNFKRFG